MLQQIKRPDTSPALAQVRLAMARRSDATDEFGNVPPRTLFDIERDAEVQELSRQLAVLTNVSKNYQRTLNRKYALYAASVLVIWIVASSLPFVFGYRFTGPISQSNEVLALSSSPTSGTPSTAPVVTTVPTPEQPVVPLPSASAPLEPLTAAVAVAKPVPEIVLSRASAVRDYGAADGASREAVPAPATVFQQAKGLPPVAIGKQSATQHKAAVDVTPVPKTTPATATDPQAKAKDESVFSLEDNQAQTAQTKVVGTDKPAQTEQRSDAATRPVAKAVTVNVSKEPVSVKGPTASANVIDAVRKETQPTSGNTIPATTRTEKYGSNGVITLMASGVVVFDKERKTQRLVPVGSALPDGSIVKGIDVKGNRVSTDRGDIVFE